MAEAFVHTLKRDYISGANLSSAAAVLDQLPAWITDYNGLAPHSVLSFRPPLAYRAERAATAAVEMVTA
jgi:transposase InsO family protein